MWPFVKNYVFKTFFARQNYLTQKKTTEGVQSPTGYFLKACQRAAISWLGWTWMKVDWKFETWAGEISCLRVIPTMVYTCHIDVYWHRYITTYPDIPSQHSYLTYFLTFYLAFWAVIRSGILFDVLSSILIWLTYFLTFYLAFWSGTLWHSVSDILFVILSYIIFDILSGILSLTFYLAFYLRVEVRQGTLRVDTRGWGPAGNTGRG